MGYGIERLSDCVFQNLTIHNSNRAIGLFVRNSQVIENLLFTNITVETRLHSGWWGAAEPIHISVVPGYTEDRAPGVIRNVRFSHILARAENGILLYGADGPDAGKKVPIQDITLEHIRLQLLPSALHSRYGGNIDLRPAHDRNCKVFSSDLAGIYAKNVKGLRIVDVGLLWPEGDSSHTPAYYRHAILLEGCENVNIREFAGEPPPSNPDNAAILRVERDGWD